MRHLAAFTIVAAGSVDIITRASSGVLVLGLLPVVPPTLGSAAIMVLVSRMTPGSRPGAGTMATYFPV